MMEVFAGFVSHADHHFGRILDTLEQIGELDNTLIMIISDNGASAEGGPTGSFNEMLFFNNVPESFEDNLDRIDELGGTKAYNHYAWGWTWAGNTPFRRWKRETYRGGSTDPFVLAWPTGIAARGEIRTQYAHAIDMVPTVLDALGIEPPTTIRGLDQSPLEGVQLRPHLRRRGRTDDAHHAVLRDVRPPLDLPRRLAGGVPVAGIQLHRVRQTGAQLGRPDHAGRARRARQGGVGALPHRVGSHGVARRRRRPSRQRAGAGLAVVGRGGQVQGVAARRLAPAAPRRGATSDRQAAHPLRVLPRRFGRSGVRRAPRVQPPLLDRGRRGDPVGRRRGRAGRARRRRRRLHLLRRRRAAALRLQLHGPRPLRPDVPRDAHRGPPRTALRVRTHRRAR